MEIIDSKTNAIQVVASSLPSQVTSKLREICIFYQNQQIIVFDVNRTWQMDSFKPGTWFFRPSTRMELIEQIRKLEEIITPRLKLVIIDGISNLLRDFQGREFKKYISNSKNLSFVLNSLANISQLGIKIIIGIYLSANKEPLFLDILNYYNIQFFLIN